MQLRTKMLFETFTIADSNASISCYDALVNRFILSTSYQIKDGLTM